MTRIEDLHSDLVNLTRDFAAICLRDAADFLGDFNLEKAHLKILVGRQQIERLQQLLAEDPRPKMSRRPKPRTDRDGDVLCPECDKPFIHLRALAVHRGRMHRLKAATP